MKNDIVIIGASYLQLPLIEKARQQGYTTHVFAWKDGSVGETIADHFYPISIVEKEEILEVCKKIQPVAVASIASDLANITVQYLAKNLGLPCNSDECIEISTNKYKMRCAFRDNGVATPYFRTISDAAEMENDTGFSFPLIVKPTDRSGSRGITKVYTAEELPAAVAAATVHSFEKKAIVEEYIEGPEFSCECISYQGKHTMLTITKKFTTGAPHFIETGHLEPAPLTEEMRETVRKEIFAGLDALKIYSGASHSEFRITPEGKVRIIEIGSRMGGDCIGSDLVRLSTGYDFVKMVLDVAAGKEPDFTPVCTPACAAVRFVFTQDDIRVLDKIKSECHEALYEVSDMEPIGDHEIVDSGTRYGHFIVTAPTHEELIRLSELSE